METKRHFGKILKKRIILVFISFFIMGCSQSFSPVFEEEVGGLKLVRLVTGEDAMYAINKLHGKKINVAKGMIAFYKGGNEKADIWVSQSFSTDDAIQQTEIMIEKMRGKGSPFSGYKEIERDGVKIYSFKGMGQEYYIFRIKKDVYWISANSSIIDELYKSIME